MKYDAAQPLIVQSDGTILLEVEHPMFSETRTMLNQIADLVKNPARLHTYLLSRLSLWNAAASGMEADQVIIFLSRHGKMGIPPEISSLVQESMQRYQLLTIESSQQKLFLQSKDKHTLPELYENASIAKFVLNVCDENRWEIKSEDRGLLKLELIKLGYPVKDLAGYHQGESVSISLGNQTKQGKSFQLRTYQQKAVQLFYQDGSNHGGNGVVVLPCGAGKTMVGIAAMSALHCATLILTTNITSIHQWKRELLDKTNLMEEQIGAYTGSEKQVRPITIATYQILTHRKTKKDPFIHMRLFNERDWGLIIYDEVHLLPAPVFRVTADIQATRRLGLTATLIREDGREDDVFSLVGPKIYDVSWKDLEREGWISQAKCFEIKVPMDRQRREHYANAAEREKMRIAAENPAKIQWIQHLLQKHENQSALIIGQYIHQLKHIAKALQVPMISGTTPQDEREKWYVKFKKKEIKQLVVSKVANFAVDLPQASVAIQVSGSFGSRQEEAQRLGRILRPKQGENQSFFYTIVSGDSKEEVFAQHRQLFLLEQGYEYWIYDHINLNPQERMPLCNL